MLEVLGRATSGNVQKVLFLLEELGAPYKRHDYGKTFEGTTLTPQYQAINPTQKVPTLRDGELHVWESHTILRYVANKQEAHALYPRDPAARSQVERWMDWTLASLNVAYLAGFKEAKLPPEQLSEAAAKLLSAELSLLDGHLAGRPWVAGEAFSLADICLAPLVRRCLKFPIPSPSWSICGNGWRASSSGRLSRRPWPRVEAGHGHAGECIRRARPGAGGGALAAQIRARGLNVDFDTRAGCVRVLSDIDIDIAKGSFTSIIGPSGCGKSTLLKVFAGLVPPTGGEVSVAGVPPGEAVRQRRVGMVFQEAALMPWKTALENVCSLMALVDAAPRERQRDRALELLRLVGLEYAADRYPAQLSGGMRQRVSIARALALDPEVLMMDEPFGALDAITREHMSDFLLDIWRRTGKTVVFVTHSIDEAVYLSDSVYVMATNPARIVQKLDIGLPQPKNEATFSSPMFHQKSFQLRQLLKAGHAPGSGK